MQIHRAHTVSVPTCAVSLVEALIARPEVLAARRNQAALETRAG